MPRADRRSSDSRLPGLRVLVTGGSSGIGLTAAEMLGAAGARVVLLARGRAGLEQAAGRVPGCAGVLAADVGDAEATRRAVDEAAGMLGGLDAVVAGAGAGSYGPFAEMSHEDVEGPIRITLLGTVNTVHAALPWLEQSRGTLVAIGSVAGRLPTPWLSSYTAAKHGVRGLMRSLDAELRAQRRPVRLALIAPGPVDTPFWRRARTPDGRLPPEIRGAYRAEDVAAEVVRAVAHPGKLERTVGGLMVPAIVVDALVPNLLQPLFGLVARLGWRAREEHPVSDDDVLTQPTRDARRDGGLVNRLSALRKLRDLVAPPR